MKIHHLCYGLLLLFPFFLPAQNLNKSRIAVRNFCDTLPFVYSRGKIIVKVNLDSLEKRFIFDTGAPLLISEELAKTMDAHPIGSGTVTDVGGRTREEKIVKVSGLSLGKVHFKDAVAMVFDPENTGLLKCFGIDGIIGSTLLKHCIVQFDLRQRNIILTDKLGNVNLSNSSISNLKLDATSRPFVDLSFGNAGNLTALFDSGSDKFLPLSTTGFEKLKTNGRAEIINKGFGSISSGLYGAGKKGQENRVNIPDLIFGKSAIRQITTTVSENRTKDAIGMALGKYGIITIDYPEKKFYFSPYAQTQNFEELPFFGFYAQLVEGMFSVSAVYENTEAERQGLKVGDQITRINETDLSENESNSLCELFLTDYLENSSMSVEFKDSSGKLRTIELQGK